MSEGLPEDTAPFNLDLHGPQGLGALPPGPPVDAYFKLHEAAPPPRVHDSAYWRKLGRDVVEGWRPLRAPARSDSGKSGGPGPFGSSSSAVIPPLPPLRFSLQSSPDEPPKYDD